MSDDTTIILGEFNSAPLFTLRPRSSQTYQRIIEVKGNSLLSSVYVKSIDPGTTIQVNYFDTTTGASFGERFDLDSHDLVDDTAAGETFRIVVTRVHRRVVCEMIITGGSAEVSVFATVISSFMASTAQEITGEVSTSGLKNGGRISEVTIDSSAWFPLPAIPLANRNSIGIQNPSDTPIKINYDNTQIGFVGVLIPAGGERFMDIKDAIPIYAKAQSGSVVLNVEEIS
jgi:hypothetical protein